MALVVESVATGTSPITKPTGLAVGDLMVALVSQSYNAAFPSASTPSGWTAEYATFDPRAYGLFWKIADSADVAASDFTFQDSASNHMTGVLYRVSGIALDSDVAFLPFSGADTSGDVNASVATSITPAYLASHFFAGYIVADDTTNGTMGTYALGGSPTFTERLDTTLGGITSFAVADAPISGLTALGNATSVTTATTPSTIRIFGMLVYTKVNATVSGLSLLQLSPQFFPTIPQFLRLTPSFYTPTASPVTPTWTNTIKHNVASVTNTPKS